MIARRLDCISDDCKANTSVHRLKFLMRVIIESGFLYLATAIAHFVVWWTPNTYAIAIISRIVSESANTIEWFKLTCTSGHILESFRYRNRI